MAPSSPMASIYLSTTRIYFGGSSIKTTAKVSGSISADSCSLQLGDSEGQPRAVVSAYIAGVIPDDDSFWEIAENRGFHVRRGFLGTNNRSKQDDAYLITDMVSTLYEYEGPATMVLMAGDADYVPPLKKALEKRWRTEVAFIERGASHALEPVVHEMRVISPVDIELM